MALESFMVVLCESSTGFHFERVLNLIKDFGGKIEFVAGNGKVIISTFDNVHFDRLQKMPGVRLVGGITFGKKEFKKIKVTEG